ncbi:MAG: histidine phosphatase family protein [Solirubrobacterales bacterium]|jgi:broad specificity phosphatase PhoE|nr:histidine phosphatase family protein [Solirubrobacterales bacterium]
MARHGQTAYNAEGRFQGTLDVPLDDVGLAQAHALAEVAAGHGIVALWCSPLLRARQTADVVGAALGLEPRADARFAEHDTGTWTDRLKAEVEAEDPELWAAYLRGGEDWSFPGGEGFEDFQERVVDGLVAMTQAKELPALVVCHRGVIRAAQAHSHIRGLDTFHEWPVPNGALIPL